MGADAAGFVWTGDIALRWRDLDALGHLYHAEYLVLLDEARVAMFATALGAAGLAEPEFVVARLEIDYRGEVVLDDGPLLARVAVQRVGRTSVTLQERLATRGGRVAVETVCVVVLWHPASRSGREVTGDERRALTSVSAHQGAARRP